ncbi:MAG TPA: hypothetical protein VK174_09150 [Chitinophagales bacterium]|nr:hypothetical protein [Chitinophagales bacterium]
MEISLPIHYSTEKIKQVFYTRKGYSLYDYPSTREKFKVTLAFGSASLIFLILSQFDTSFLFIWLFGFSVFIFCFSAADLYIAYKPIIDWKKKINDYLKEVSAYNSVVLTITDKSITHQYDDRTEIIMWQAIVSSIIEPGYIRLEDKARGILIFEHSMPPQDYQAILALAKGKLI